jgi:hypothetical protein
VMLTTSGSLIIRCGAIEPRLINDDGPAAGSVRDATRSAQASAAPGLLFGVRARWLIAQIAPKPPMSLKAAFAVATVDQFVDHHKSVFASY